MKIAARVAAATLMIVAFAGISSAHTISIGYANSGPGSVTFWYGSYHESVGYNEGSLNLVGINGNAFASTTVGFSELAYSQPDGVIDGVTNFYSNNAGDALLSTDADGLGPVLSWQGVQFDGLGAGDYTFTYVPIADPTYEWAPWGDSVLSNNVTLSDEVISGTPEPASFALFGTALVGLGVLRLRRKQNS